MSTRPARAGDDPADEDNVWVTSRPDIEGTYRVEVSWGQDVVRSLTRDECVAYAGAVLAQAERAAHDAAVLALLLSTGLPLKDAGWFVAQLRADRPPIDPATTAPFVLEPGVAERDRTPFLGIVMGDGRKVGQWTVGDAYRHALGVLQIAQAADLDTLLLRHLRRTGVGLDRALSVVMSLPAHRHDDDTPRPE